MNNDKCNIFNEICALGVGFLLGTLVFIPFVTNNYHIPKRQARNSFFTLPNNTIWKQVYYDSQNFKELNY